MISRDCKVYYVESIYGKHYIVFNFTTGIEVQVQESPGLFRIMDYNFEGVPLNLIIDRLESGMFDSSDNELLIEYMLAVLKRGETEALLFLHDKYCSAVLERLECILKGK
jgi:hypothetical protein